MATHSQYGQELISWTFPEFVSHQRGRRWYYLAIPLTVIFLIIAIVSANFLFAVIIIVTVLIIFFKRSGEPLTVAFAIYEGGIRVGGKFYEFNEIKSFYVIYEPPEVKNLYLQPNGMWQPRLTIPLFDNNPIKIREILLDYLEEDLDKENEPLSDAAGRMFKL